MEMSVALAVSAIALAMLALILSYANAFTQTKQLQTAVMQEVSLFKQTFDEALEAFQSPNYDMRVAENQLIFESSGTKETISFSNGKLWQNGEALQSCQHIENVAFALNGNLINCTLEYHQQTQTLVFFKRI